MTDMVDTILKNGSVYHSRRERVDVTDDWGRPVYDEKGKTRKTYKHHAPERNFRTDLVARGVESGLTEAEATLVADTALEMQAELFDTDRDGMYSTVEAADYMMGLARKLHNLKA